MLSGKRLEKRRKELYEVTKNSWLGELLKEDAFLEGTIKGKAEGKAETKITVIQRALQSGLDISLVAKITATSAQEVLQIQNDLC